MLYIAENLRALRRCRDMTQETVAELLNVSPQSVSKWERGEACPDIALLPALANLYHTSVDALLGMDRINDAQTKSGIFSQGQNLMRRGDYSAAADVYAQALKTYPGDLGYTASLAMALALGDDPSLWDKAARLCEDVLAGRPGEKNRHTVRAALCFIYIKAGDRERAMQAAKNLPHVRECRENVLAHLEQHASPEEIDTYLRFIAIGECDEQDIITVDIGLQLAQSLAESGLIEGIKALRGDAGSSKDGYRKLPAVRVRDNTELRPRQVKIRFYAERLLDGCFDDMNEASSAILAALGSVVKRR